MRAIDLAEAFWRINWREKCGGREKQRQSDNTAEDEQTGEREEERGKRKRITLQKRGREKTKKERNKKTAPTRNIYLHCMGCWAGWAPLLRRCAPFGNGNADKTRKRERGERDDESGKIVKKKTWRGFYHQCRTHTFFTVQCLSRKKSKTKKKDPSNIFFYLLHFFGLVQNSTVGTRR